MTRAIYFDMDGTIANLYGVDGWLNNLEHEQTRPYREAKPMVNMRALSHELNRLQRAGYVVGIVSWLSKSGTTEYNNKVTKTKMQWLDRHIGSVQFDEIHIIKYGTPKSTVVNVPNEILFDDEERNRKEWALGDGMAFGVDNILEILRCMG